VRMGVLGGLRVAMLGLQERKQVGKHMQSGVSRQAGLRATAQLTAARTAAGTNPL
jgi:hypothetical protein